MTVWDKENFTGNSEKLNIGDYNLPTLTIGNDKIQSVNVPFGLGAQFFWDINFGGINQILEYGSFPSLGGLWNHQTSSVKILNRTVLYLSTDDPMVPGSIPAMIDGIKLTYSSDLPDDGNASLSATPIVATKSKKYFKHFKITIPEGKTFFIWETTQNGRPEGRAGWGYSFNQTTREFFAYVFVVQRSVFGTRNWIGIAIVLK